MNNRIKRTITALAAALLALPALAPAAGMLDLPRTGQERCYNTAGTEIACSGTGQDGAVRAGVALPVPRFKDNGDGTVTDKVTGLIWLKNANCFGGKVWADALTAASTLANGACGLTDGSKAGDWRLPNRTEMLSIIDTSKVNPALPAGYPFANVAWDWYKTSTTYAGNGSYAWVVHLGSGVAGYSYGNYDVYGYYSQGYKSGNYYVWPVRAGQ